EDDEIVTRKFIIFSHLAIERQPLGIPARRRPGKAAHYGLRRGWSRRSRAQIGGGSRPERRRTDLQELAPNHGSIQCVRAFMARGARQGWPTGVCEHRDQVPRFGTAVSAAGSSVF